MEEMSLIEALYNLESLSERAEGNMVKRTYSEGGEVFMTRENIIAINTIKRYFAEHMDELED